MQKIQSESCRDCTKEGRCNKSPVIYLKSYEIKYNLMADSYFRISYQVIKGNFSDIERANE